MSAVRQVRTLNLAAPHREAVGPARALVEDALHTASLPLLRPGAMLLIRRLDLGTISLRWPSQTLALRITEVVRQAFTSAVHASSPQARTAAAIWFASPSEARAAAAVRLIVGPPPTEWFWVSALPILKTAAPLSTLLASLLEAPAFSRADEPPPAVVAAQTLGRLATQGRAEAVLQHLPRDLAWSPGFRLLWGPSEPLLQTRQPLSSSDQAPVRIHDSWLPVLRWAARLPSTDARRLLVSVSAVIAGSPERAGSPEVPRLAARLLAAASESALPRPLVPSREDPPVSTGETRLTTSHPAATTPPEASPVKQQRRHELISTPAPVPEAEPLEGPAPPRLPSREHPQTPAPRWLASDGLDPYRMPFGPPPVLEAPARTELGGLLFFIHVLRSLGFDEHLDEAARDCALGWRVLAGLGSAMNADPHEPILRAIAPTADPLPPGTEPFTAPRSWRRSLRLESLTQHLAGPGMLLGEQGLWLARWQDAQPADLDTLTEGLPILPGPPLTDQAWAQARVRTWVRAVLRWCRLHDVHPEELATRPAVVSATPTHVDLVLSASSVDLSLRRLALDTTPGWVPWLGRIVAVHYVEPEAFEQLSRSLDG